MSSIRRRTRDARRKGKKRAGCSGGAVTARPSLVASAPTSPAANLSGHARSAVRAGRMIETSWRLHASIRVDSTGRERLYGLSARACSGLRGGACADYAFTPASRGVNERVASLRWYDWSSFNSGVCSSVGETLPLLRGSESVAVRDRSGSSSSRDKDSDGGFSRIPS